MNNLSSMQLKALTKEAIKLQGHISLLLPRLNRFNEHALNIAGIRNTTIKDAEFKKIHLLLGDEVVSSVYK